MTVCRQLCPEVEMEGKMERRVNLKFCVKLLKSPNEMLEVLKTVYVEFTVGKSNF
jgi:hypothetical protein